MMSICVYIYIHIHTYNTICVKLYIYIYIYMYYNTQPGIQGSAGNKHNTDAGFHRRAPHESPTCCYYAATCCNELSHFATFCHMLLIYCRILPTIVH